MLLSIAGRGGGAGSRVVGSLAWKPSQSAWYSSRDTKHNVVPFHDENIPFFKLLDLQFQFHYFQKKCDAIISKKLADTINESNQQQKDFYTKVEKSMKLRRRRFETMAENPPMIFPRAFNAHPMYSDENYLSNAAMKSGYNPLDSDLTEECIEEHFEGFLDAQEEIESEYVKKDKDDDEDEDEAINSDDDEDLHEINDDVALHYVASNWNTLKVYERTFDLLSEHYAHFQSLNNMHKMSVFPQNPPVGKIGFMDFDPVQWRASKQRRWEAITGITQEELKKLGLNVSLRKFPMYPDNIPMIFPLRVESENEACYVPTDMPLDAPKAFMNLMRDRVTVKSDVPPPSPPRKQDGKTIHVIRDYYLEPSYRDTFREQGDVETRNVILKVKVSDLGLPPLAAHRLIAIAGSRYHRKTDTLKIVGNKFQDKKTNSKYALQLLRELLRESLLAVPQFVSYSKKDDNAKLSPLPPPVLVPSVPLGEDQPFVLFRFMPNPF